MQATTEAIGLLAGTLTTIAFVPQLLKIYRIKSGKDISARMSSLFSAGIVLWLIYGVLVWSVPLILTNAVTARAVAGHHRPQIQVSPTPARRRAGHRAALSNSLLGRRIEEHRF
jgi:MtN3 and saliva related transmembrane protein